MEKGEINLLWNEIDTLLTDICTFLKKEIQCGTMSANSRNFANAIINRSSKVQLKAISNVTSTLDISDPLNESYVDMQSPKVIVAASDLQEVYSDISFEEFSNFSVMDDDVAITDDVCPYDNLSAAEIKKGKSGHLYRKEKFLFFDQQRKVFAAIRQSWLLIYINEHSLKPSQIFNLGEYNATVTPSKEIKKRDESFSLHSLLDLKSYQFTALTTKDMLQWVTAINYQSELIQSKKKLLPIPTTINTESIDAFESDSSSNAYEPLSEYRLQKEQDFKQKFQHSTITKKPLPLPPRNIHTKTSSAIIERAPSEESMGDYDCVGPAPEDSFSEENEDEAFYDNPAEIKQKFNYTNTAHSIKTDNAEDEEIYDYLQNPSEFLVNSHTDNNVLKEIKSEKIQENYNKQETVTDKYKSMLKPKILSFRHKRKNT